MSRNKEKEINDVNEAITSLAKSIVASTGKKEGVDKDYYQQVKIAETMLVSLCEMYHIAHYT